MSVNIQVFLTSIKLIFSFLCTFTGTTALFYSSMTTFFFTPYTGCTHRPPTCHWATAHLQGSEVTGRWGRDTASGLTGSTPWTRLWTEPSEQLSTWNVPLDTWLALWLQECNTRSCSLSPAATSLLTQLTGSSVAPGESAAPGKSNGDICLDWAFFLNGSKPLLLCKDPFHQISLAVILFQKTCKHTLYNM